MMMILRKISKEMKENTAMSLSSNLSIKLISPETSQCMCCGCPTIKETLSRNT